uniref:Uncharacterized protein n=1 Tax=Arundo donax TaxID=35708 RepID=A0A0A9AQ78_ARUDO
MVANRGANR